MEVVYQEAVHSAKEASNPEVHSAGTNSSQEAVHSEGTNSSQKAAKTLDGPPASPCTRLLAM